MPRFEDDRMPVGKYVTGVVILIIVIWFLTSLIVIVGAGERGVVLRFGQVEDRVLDEGLHFITPIMESVTIMNVKTLKYEAVATAASKDLQDTKTSVALNFHLNPVTVNKLYQTLGISYPDTFISPAIQETVKATTAEFNAEELITQRPLVKQKIEDSLRARLTDRGIIMETVSITDFAFSDQFTQAIESKVTAQQLALKAENDLLRISIEANQTIAKAQGDARGIEIVQQQLKFSPEYISYLALTKWDGKLPTVTGGAIPLISLPKVI
jgi:prohibitin 2